MLLPTNRLIRTVREILLETHTPFLPDHICTPDQFTSILLTRHGGGVTEIDRSSARIILSGILQEHKASLPLFFARDTPSPRTLQDLQTLISVIIRRSISYPECLGDLQSSKSEQISHILDAYRSYLTQSRLVDPDTLLDWAVTFLQGYGSENERPFIGSVFVYGLFEPLPLEQRFLSLVLQHAETAEYIIPDGDDAKIFSDTGDWLGQAEEHLHHTEMPGRERTAIFSSHQAGAADTSLPGVFCTACADPASEMRAIAQKIVSLHQRGISYDQMVVAFPDLRTALAYASEIFPDYAIPWHTSSPPPISWSPVISFLLRVGELVEKGFRYEELIQVIQSPYFRFCWREDAETQQGPVPACYNLAFRQVEIICRAYGITSGYTDWEAQVERIESQLSEAVDANQNTGDETSIKNNTSPGNRYSTEQPLPTEEIRLTLWGMSKFLTLLRRLTGNKTVAEHRETYGEVLREIGVPVPNRTLQNKQSGTLLTNRELRLVDRFSRILDQVHELTRGEIISTGARGEAIPFSSYINLVRLLVQDAAEEPDPEEEGVLLTGMREIAHQQYPYLFLASLNEGLIPRLTTRLPFTTGSESSRMETRSLSDILRQEKYQFIAALMAGSRETYLSFYEQADEKTALSSPFLDTLIQRYKIPSWGDLKEGHGKEESDQDPDRCCQTVAARRAGELISTRAWGRALTYISSTETLDTLVSRIEIERRYRFSLNRSVYDGLIGDLPGTKEWLCHRFGPTYQWSASMLEGYAQCPFRFYLERVVHIRPLADPGADLSPVARGNLIHAILCRFTRLMHDTGRYPLTSDAADEATEELTRIAELEFEQVSYTTPLWVAKKRQFLGGEGIGPGIGERFVQAEVTRLASDDEGRTPDRYLPSAFEFSFGDTAGGPDEDPGSVSEPVDLQAILRDLQISEDQERETAQSPGDNTSVLLSGRIDRIDITADGRFGVVDYKTGTKIPSATAIAKGEVLQLPLYIHAYQQITAMKGVFGSYYHIARTISHAIHLYDPAYRSTLPQGTTPRSEPDWDGIMNNAVGDACRYVRRIHEGVFPIQATDSCNPDWYCPYTTICRFQPERGSRLNEWVAYPHTSEQYDRGES